MRVGHNPSQIISSVTVSIMVLLANQGLMSMNIGMYVILGCNIGACTSAVLASLNGKKDAVPRTGK